MDPFRVLGVAINASADEIRSKYLELTKKYPPDRAPDEFARVRAAYDELSDPVRHVNYLLFGDPIRDGIEAVVTEAIAERETGRFSTEALLAAARDLC